MLVVEIKAESWVVMRNVIAIIIRVEPKLVLLLLVVVIELMVMRGRPRRKLLLWGCC